MTESTGAYPAKSAALIGNKRTLKHGHNPRGHPSLTYNSWAAMCRRCRLPRPGYENISVCARWVGQDGFTNFLADMGERPSDKTIHRIDNDGNYEPSNCRWATGSEQQRNKRPMPPDFNAKRITTRRAMGGWNKRNRPA